MQLSAARSAGLLLGMALLAACSGSAPRHTPEPSFAPALTVERFLRAANENDLDTMAALFGTRDGVTAKRDDRRLVDRQMFVIASVLRHSDYTITGEQIVPGRRDEATQLNVSMVIGGNSVPVPFTLVRTKDRTWLIEQIGLENVTRSRGTR